MKVIVLLNEKGGVGKTFMATHIAAGLAVRGKKVVLIDADAQGQATIQLGLKRENGLLNLLVNNADWYDVLRAAEIQRWQKPGEYPTGLLTVVPGDAGTRAIPTSIDDVTLLAERLDELQNIDVVVIDTSPTPSLLHSTIYIAADGLILPTECAFLSVDGLAQTIGRASKANKLRQMEHGKPALEVVGIAPNKFKRQLVIHNKQLTMLRQRFGRTVMTAIPGWTVFEETSAAQRLIWNFQPKSLPTQRASEVMWKWVAGIEQRMEALWPAKT